jgi:alpha-1,2-mannosyltransferase
VNARLLAGGVILLLLTGLFAFKASAKMADFEVYWRAGARAAAAEPLYRAEDGHYLLKYLPAFAILAIPAALLPLGAAKAVWFTCSVLLIGAVLALSLGLLPARNKPQWVLVTVALAVMAKFYGHELVLGQVNLLLAAILLTAVYLSVRGRAVSAGLLVALAIVIKPYAVIFLPWFAARRAFGALAGSAIGIAVALLLPVFIYGLGGTVGLHRDWWRTVTESTAPNLLNPDNVSLAAMFAKWMGPGTQAAGLALAAAVVLLIVAAGVFAKRRDVHAPEGLEAALLLTLMPLLSPQGWDYVLLVSTPAVMYLVNYDRDLPAPVRTATIVALAAIALSLYDVIGRRAYGVFMALSIVSVCYLIVIGSLATLRLRRVA